MAAIPLLVVLLPHKPQTTTVGRTIRALAVDVWFGVVGWLALVDLRTLSVDVTLSGRPHS